MPSVGTGAMLANRSLKAVGVSGDGDSGSIGMGQFKHVIRRNVPLVYIIENNGVYGLTKGQHSATQDKGVKQKYYGINQFPGIDLCIEALVGEATFVARSFAGAPKQVRELLKAAMSHDGLALVDIISPCVAFNDTPESTKSYAYGRTHQVSLHDVSYVPPEEEIYIDEEAYDDEGRQVVELHDGSRILLRKLDESYNPTNRAEALKMLEEARADREIITGLIFYDDERPNLVDTENLVDTPLVHLSQSRLRPPKERLDEIMQDLML
jgi:2-oxoglutarate ferredoxin oxidoreductase subunit beta